MSAIANPSACSQINECVPNYRHVIETFINQSDGKQVISHQIESFKLNKL